MSQFRDNSWLANARSYGVLKSLRCSARYAKAKSKSAINLNSHLKQQQKKQDQAPAKAKAKAKGTTSTGPGQAEEDQPIYANVDEVVQVELETEHDDALMGNAQMGNIIDTAEYNVSGRYDRMGQQQTEYDRQQHHDSPRYQQQDGRHYHPYLRNQQPGPRPPQAAPRHPQPAPRYFQAAPRHPQPAPRSFQAPRFPQPAPRSFQAPRLPQPAPRLPQPAPHSSQAAPRLPQPAPRSSQAAPRLPQPAPRSSQEASHPPQAASRQQNGPRSHPYGYAGAGYGRSRRNRSFRRAVLRVVQSAGLTELVAQSGQQQDGPSSEAVDAVVPQPTLLSQGCQTESPAAIQSSPVIELESELSQLDLIAEQDEEIEKMNLN